jgi:hypothetical protein
MSRGTIIDGIAACQSIDSSGEILDIAKLDISSLGSDDSVLNYEHKGKESPSQVIGKVTFAKKIFKLSDCSNKREEYWWNKTKKPMVYIKAELFDGEGHIGAKDAAAIFRYKNRHKGKLGRSLMGLSIEGGTMERDGMLLGYSLARDVAATCKPCNKTCLAEIVEEESFNLYKNEIQDYTDVEVEDLIKQRYPEMQPPKMSSDQAQKEFGKVTVKDTPPQPGFGKVTVKDQGEAPKPSRRIGVRPPGAQDKQMANPAKSGQKPTDFVGKMSEKYQHVIPEGHEHRKQMSQHILDTHKKGDVNEARRLFDRFISGGGSFTKDLGKSEMKKKEKLQKALTAGGMGGAPSSWTQGRALSSEDMGTSKKVENVTFQDEDLKIVPLKKPKKTKKRKKIEKSEAAVVRDELFEGWRERDKFLGFLENRLPNLAKKEIVSLAKVYCYRVHMEAEYILAKSMDTVKKGKPHFILSAEKARHPRKNTMNHDQAIKHLKSKGMKAETVYGHYGEPERSILVHEPKEHHVEHLKNLARDMGQESSLESDGTNHKLHFHHGEHAGKHVKGSGTDFSQKRPKDNYTTLRDGTHFQHNLDFGKMHESKGK